MKRETKRETQTATIDDNPRSRLPSPLPPPHRILGLRKWVLGLRRGESKPKNHSEKEEKQDGERDEKSNIEERERINQI